MSPALRRVFRLLALLSAVPAAAQVPAAPQAALAPSSAPAATPAASDTTPAAADVDPALREENILLFELDLDQLAVTDSLAVYGTADDPLIPLGELARLLQVDLTVSPAERRITGNVGEARRPVLIDLATGLARLNGAQVALKRSDVAVGLTDIYVRRSLLQQILPVTVTVDEPGLRIVLKALEPLPIQSRLDRLGRLRDLQPDMGDRSEVLRIRSPHRLISPPAFDISLATAKDTRDPKFPKRYDIRAGADVLYTGFQGFVGSDDSGKPTTARALFERRNPNGLFGPLHVTRASAGDIFTPTLPIGPRSVGGRGVSFTTAPLEQASVFERIDLRGELPLGYDVELYINDVLRSGQQTPVRGRYEFRDVPLVRGINVIRVVSYGPRGERSEEVRVISVGGGQLAKGQFVVDGGVAQQEKNLVRLRDRDPLEIPGPGEGKLRLAVNAAYGLTEGMTLTAGLANYSPTGIGERKLGTLGLRTSLVGLATSVDVAHDDHKGAGLALGLAGQPFGISTIVRHAEYRGRFIDETIPKGGDGRALTRYSDVTFDLAVRPFGKVSLPISFRVERDQFVNGDVDFAGAFRISTSFGRALLSAGLDYDRLFINGADTNDRLTGNITGSTYAAFEWQLRAGLDYDILPTAHLRATSLTADKNIGKNIALRLGLGHSFRADKNSTAQASTIFRLPFGDLSLDGDYELNHGDWRIGLQFAFSLGFDPLGGRYVARPIGAGSGGNLALQAFVDANGDGLYQADEDPVPGVTVDGSGRRAVTDANGRAFVTGLGYSPIARAQIGIDEVDLPYVTSPPSTVEFTPRAGRTVVAMYPLKPESEVLVRLLTKQASGKLLGLSTVKVRVVRADGKSVEGSTEYDGTVVFDKLESGPYRLELDEAQAKRLKMHLAAPIAFVVPPGGGMVPDIRGEIVFERREE